MNECNTDPVRMVLGILQGAQQFGRDVVRGAHGRWGAHYPTRPQARRTAKVPQFQVTASTPGDHSHTLDKPVQRQFTTSKLIILQSKGQNKCTKSIVNYNIGAFLQSNLKLR